MIQIIGIIFIAVVIIALILEDKKSSKEFYEKRIKELEKSNRVLTLEGQLNSTSEEEEFCDAGFTSEKQFNDAIDEIEKGIKYSPLERIYYETQLPDQLKNEVGLRVKTKEYLNYLSTKGVSEKDIQSAKGIIALRENILCTQLDLESFVEDYINKKGKYIAEEIYLGLVKIFELSGRDISKSKEVYNKLFSDLLF